MAIAKGIIMPHYERITPKRVREALKEYPHTRWIAINICFFMPEKAMPAFREIYERACVEWSKLRENLHKERIVLFPLPGVAAWEAYFWEAYPFHVDKQFIGAGTPEPVLLDSVKEARAQIKSLVPPAPRQLALQPITPPVTPQSSIGGKTLESLEGRINILALGGLSIRKITARLHDQGIIVSHMKVARVLKKHKERSPR